MEFKSIEEAVKHITGLDTQLAASKKATDAALKGKNDAEAIANDALAKLQKVEDLLPKKITGKVGTKNYEVIFGVDGLTKEELAKDKEKLALLAKSGSSAIKIIED